MVRLWLLIVMASWCLAAPAMARTGLLPVDASAMGVDEIRMKRGIVDVAKDVLKVRFVEIVAERVPEGTARCIQDPACIARLAAQGEFDDVAFVSAERTASVDPWAAVTLTIFDPEGEATFRATQPISTDTDLKALMTRAFEPARYTGRLDLLGVGADDIVLIDGLRGATTSLVRAGHHTVVVRHADSSVTTLPVEVAFDAQTAVEIPPAASPASRSPSPVVKSVVGASVAVIGSVGVVVGALQLASLGPALDLARQAIGNCPPGSFDPSGNSFNDVGVRDATGTPIGACSAALVRHHHQLELQRDVATVALVAGGVVAAIGIAVVGSTIPWLMSQEVTQ